MGKFLVKTFYRDYSGRFFPPPKLFYSPTVMVEKTGDSIRVRNVTFVTRRNVTETWR